MSDNDLAKMSDNDLAKILATESDRLVVVAAALQDSCNNNLAVEIRRTRNTIDGVIVELRARSIGGKE